MGPSAGESAERRRPREQRPRREEEGGSDVRAMAVSERGDERSAARGERAEAGRGVGRAELGQAGEEGR